MNSNKPETKKIILFSSLLSGVGGAERLLFEEAKYFQKQGDKTYILTFEFKKEVLFDNTYEMDVKQVGHITRSSNLLVLGIHLIRNVLALRKRIKQVAPDIILLSTARECVPFYFATLFTSYSYSTHIHATMFWYRDELLRYTFVHRKVFNEIRESVYGHKEFIPAKRPKVSLIKRIVTELEALVMYRAVRKAKKIFVLSNQMKWEVSKLYGKEAIVAKGAFSKQIFDHKPKKNVKERLGIKDKRMILNINRFYPEKRVDLLIKAFKQLSDHLDDLVLIIGGSGGIEEGRLRDLAKELNLASKINFVGYIKESELWDYLAACDVFVHPFWREYGIIAYEALALNRKVVWSTEMEIDEHLAGNRHIFAANPTVDDFAAAIEKALATEVTEINDLSVYTWDNYCKRVLRELHQP